MENIGIYQIWSETMATEGDLVDDVLGNPEGVCKMSIFSSQLRRRCSWG